MLTISDGERVQKLKCHMRKTVPHQTMHVRVSCVQASSDKSLLTRTPRVRNRPLLHSTTNRASRQLVFWRVYRTTGDMIKQHATDGNEQKVITHWTARTFKRALSHRRWPTTQRSKTTKPEHWRNRRSACDHASSS